jgi:hypothetical protein
LRFVGLFTVITTIESVAKQGVQIDDPSSQPTHSRPLLVGRENGQNQEKSLSTIKLGPFFISSEPAGTHVYRRTQLVDNPWILILRILKAAPVLDTSFRRAARCLQSISGRRQ